MNAKNPAPKPSMALICGMFKCTPAQVRLQYQANIRQLDGILTEARKLPPGGKHRGLTADQWEAKNDQFKITAATVCAQEL